MEMEQIKALIKGNEKAATMVSAGYFLASIMFVSKTLFDEPASTMVNFYNRDKKEIAAFSIEPDGMKFSGLSPPMKDVDINPLDMERVSTSMAGMAKKCVSRNEGALITRAVFVLRTSSNSKGETGPCWHANMFLANLHVLSIIFDAETGDEISSTKTKLFGTA